MKRIAMLCGAAVLVPVLAACAVGGGTGQAGARTPGATRATAVATPAANSAAAQTAATVTPVTEIALGISGTGEVKAAQDADLTFQVSGSVAAVNVKEGDVVTKGQVLANLNLRLFDQQVRQAQASLASAQAQQAGLTEGPRADQARAARAQVQAAQAALAQLKVPAKSQDVQSSQASLKNAQTNLQATKDQLSTAKSRAESQLKQAAESLTQSQAGYAKAKSDWEYVQSTGNNPTNPTTTTSGGKAVDNKVTDGQRQTYYATFVQAEASMHASEQALTQAQLAYDQARQAEVTGVQVSEQQVVQAQAALDKLTLPVDPDKVAQAQAALAQAQSTQAGLTAAPKDSAKAQAEASIAQAEAALEAAQINRENAELKSPFDGVVAVVNIDPGDPSSVGAGNAAIQVVDTSALHIDAAISDVDIAQVSVGQKAQVFIDAIPGTVYTATVSYIAPTVTTTGSVRSYLVRLTLDNQTGLRSGMSVRIDIEKPKGTP